MDFEIITSTPLRQVPADYAPPGAHRWFALPDGPDAGRTLFYVDHTTGPGEPEQTVVLVHGNPECSYTFRRVVAGLAGSGRTVRIIAMDHLGFGLSDQASFEMVDMHHAANLSHLITHLDLSGVTLVVHDWGGPIGVGAFLDEPERVRALVVLNTSVFPMPAAGYRYTNYPYRWLAWSWTPFLIPNRLWGGVAGKVVVDGEPQGGLRFLLSTARNLATYARRRYPPASPAFVFAEQFRSPANARASKRHVRQTPVFGRGYRYDDATQGPQDNHEFYRRLQRDVPAVWGPGGRAIPTAGFFGAWDALGKPEVVAQWHDALPQMKGNTHVYPDHGHFIEEHRGPEIAVAILDLPL